MGSSARNFVRALQHGHAGTDAAAYRAEPAAGVQALVLQHITMSLNPRQGLTAGERLSGPLVASGQHHDDLDAFGPGQNASETAGEAGRGAGNRSGTQRARCRREASR
jgi:hypothetical protein